MIEIVLGVLVLIIGLFGFLYIKKDKETKGYIEQIAQLKEANIYYKTTLELQANNANEKLQLLKDNEEQLKMQFQNLANTILEKNSKNINELQSQNLKHILEPFKTQISEFKKKVDDVYDKESRDRSALQQELKILKELNQKISQDAINLTNALKGQNKTQGNWGEMVLHKVLESSGLRLGHEYQKEVSLKDDDNQRYRPDVIVNLPDNRHIIVDAKTSLNAYTEYINANDEEKGIYLKSHILSIKEHIKSLSIKKYENLKEINSLDFVFMFIPIESALMLALENDVNLYDEAFKQKIILVSPTTLLVALRAVENTWRYERQAQNIADVAKRAELLYNKFQLFVEDLQKVGVDLNKATNSYQQAFSKLSSGDGNLIWQATQLKKVANIKPKKELSNHLIDIAEEENN